MELNNETALSSYSGRIFEVKKYLGSGDQGEVYDAASIGKHYTLKCYFREATTNGQGPVFENLLDK